MKTKKFYITTTLPYVNALPHIGHTLEFIQADVITRYKREKLGSQNVWLNVGADEHGLKNAQAAEKEGVSPKEYVDKLASQLIDFCALFNISYNTFYRTSDSKHYTAATKFWEASNANGDIYKKKYSGLYCISCEEFKTDKEIVNDRCVLHPSKDLVAMEEENYFFRLSKYKEQLLKWLDENPEVLKPKRAVEELRNWISEMEDISISRSKENLKWGIPVPGDDNQVMYVWFDALTNYINVLGYGAEGEISPFEIRKFDENIASLTNDEDERKTINDKRITYEDWWPGVQTFGVDNLRFQAAIWQAMLLSAGQKQTAKLLRHGFILGPDGRKMSKSEGNTVSPFEQQAKFGTEPVRFYLIAGIPTYSDSPYKEDELINLYNSHLANNFGNLLNRVVHLAKKKEVEINNFENLEPEFQAKVDELVTKAENFYEDYELQQAAATANELATFGNEHITQKEPWGKDKTQNEISQVLNNLSYLLSKVIELYSPIIPEACHRARLALVESNLDQVLFPKIEVI